jgi:hypothetical protein
MIVYPLTYWPSGPEVQIQRTSSPGRSTTDTTRFGKQAHDTVGSGAGTTRNFRR